MEQGQGQLPMNFNLNDAREMLCECGNNTFMPGFRFRKVSRLIEMYLCTQCGKPLQDLLPDELKDKKIVE
jgi:hypothetical protein